MAARIIVIEGDGIGREVIPAAAGVLRRLGLGLEFENLDAGAERFLRIGEALTGDDMQALWKADAILLGAIGDPRITDPGYTSQTLGRIRGELDLYANVRPARLLAGRLSPLRDPERRRADMIVVRENTEGLYTTGGGRLRAGTPGEVAVQQHISTHRGVTRILGYAFSLARDSVVMADKWNAMPHAGALWQRCWREAQAAHPEVAARHEAIDACAMHMIRDPSAFDVIVAENCFGDILSDIAAGLTGGVGLAPSANLNPETGRALFEPVHGSAPDIAGSGVANPAAAILSCAMMLRHLGFAREADAVRSAVAAAVEAGDCTPDAGGTLSTHQAADAVLKRIS